MDIEAGIAALMPMLVPPPTALTPIPGTMWPMGAMPGRGTTAMG